MYGTTTRFPGLTHSAPLVGRPFAPHVFGRSIHHSPHLTIQHGPDFVSAARPASAAAAIIDADVFMHPSDAILGELAMPPPALDVRGFGELGTSWPRPTGPNRGAVTVAKPMARPVSTSSSVSHLRMVAFQEDGIEYVRMSVKLSDKFHASPITLVMNALRKYPEAALYLKRRGKDERVPVLQTNFFSLMVLAIPREETVEWVATGVGAIDLLEELDAFNRAGWKNGEATEKAGLILVRRVGLTDEASFLRELAKAFREIDTHTISGVYNARTIVLGDTRFAHGVIAKAGGLSPSGSFRVNFELDSSGVIHGFLPDDDPYDVCAMPIDRGIATLFPRLFSEGGVLIHGIEI